MMEMFDFKIVKRQSKFGLMGIKKEPRHLMEN